ncbi:MAG: hypothetical protein OEV57_00890 [Dehalococcoidia bacterium]|nr:hypothetical protein [Dehalococcoidia bacterium]
MIRVCSFLISVALIAGMAGCDGNGGGGNGESYTLTVNSTVGGVIAVDNVIIPGETMFTYDPGTVVGLNATADFGYHFLEWTGNVSTVGDVTAAVTNITMNGNYTITADFYEPEIWDWYDLDGVRNNLGGSYLLMNNLDSTSVGYEELAGPTADGDSGWEPIGTTEPFSPIVGSVDGQGYEIRDLFIDRPDQDSVGLFGIIDEGGVIKNIGVVSLNVTGRIGVGSLLGNNWGGTVMDCYSSGSVAGAEFVGGLIGMNDDGTVINCRSASGVAGDLYTGGLIGGHWSGLVSNSYSNGTVIGQDGVGGLVGENHEGAIDGSYATGNVTGSWSVGGLLGENHGGRVEDSYAVGGVTGAVFAGGLVGYNDGTVLSSYAAAAVSGDEYVGGLAGWTGWQGTVTNSFWDTQASGIEESAGGTGKTTEEMQAFATFTDIETEGLDEPWDMVAVAVGEIDGAYVWNIVDGLTYPFLGWQSLS